MEMLLVRTTVEAEATARTMARGLIEARLAACVHVQRITSSYRWEGRIVEEEEWLVEARTTSQAAARVEAWIAAEHPYSLPCIERLGSAVNPAYGDWARHEIGS